MASPIFPANYRESYSEVRNCRIGQEHDGYSVRVWASPIAAQPYLNNQNPLPEGSIVVKEEFDAADCSNDAKLVGWSAMRKEAPGFDPVDANWHWQRVHGDRTVLTDDKSPCITCHRAPACVARDYMCEDPGQAQPPALVLKEVPAALLAVSGTSPNDVYVVGADPPNDDFGPYVLHYDGQNWKRLNTGATGTLWWMSITPIDGAFYMAGENGLILRFDLTTRQFTQYTTPGNQTLFGIWGLHANNLWAVGGDRNSSNEDEGGVIWHFDGNTWTVEDLTGVRAQGIPLRFKVWGRADDDIYAVGLHGVILHYDGSSWTQMNSNSVRPLISVHGNATDTVAVGGFFDGVILERAGDEFVDRTPQGAMQVNGVFIPPQGGGVGVGIAGSINLKKQTGWEIQNPVDTIRDFHATWVDPEGGVWAVGGDLTTALNHGILAYGGVRMIGNTIVQIDPCPPGPSGGPSTVSFTNQITPILNQAGCKDATCHAGPFAASNYSQERYDLMFHQGVFAKSLKVCPIVPGNPDASFMIEKLGPNPRLGIQMPPNPPPLTEEQLNLIRTWILEGAQNDAPTPTVAQP